LEHYSPAHCGECNPMRALRQHILTYKQPNKKYARCGLLNPATDRSGGDGR
jgi:hypothetical protein